MRRAKLEGDMSYIREIFLRGQSVVATSLLGTGSLKISLTTRACRWAGLETDRSRAPTCRWQVAAGFYRHRESCPRSAAAAALLDR